MVRNHKWNSSCSPTDKMNGQRSPTSIPQRSKSVVNPSGCGTIITYQHTLRWDKMIVHQHSTFWDNNCLPTHHMTWPWTFTKLQCAAKWSLSRLRDNDWLLTQNLRKNDRLPTHSLAGQWSHTDTPSAILILSHITVIFNLIFTFPFTYGQYL